MCVSAVSAGLMMNTGRGNNINERNHGIQKHMYCIENYLQLPFTYPSFFRNTPFICTEMRVMCNNVAMSCSADFSPDKLDESNYSVNRQTRYLSVSL